MKERTPEQLKGQTYKNYEVFLKLVECYETGLFNRILYEREYNIKAKFSTEDGHSEKEARMNAAEVAYKYLEKNNLLYTIRDEIENPNKEESINQLEILARRGYFSIPTYDFDQKYDADGNPIWKSDCHIKEYDKVTHGKGSTKKEAKKVAAFNMLKYILDNYT